MDRASIATPQPCGRRNALVFLLRGPAQIVHVKATHVGLITQAAKIDVQSEDLARMARAGLIIRSQAQVALTPAGRELAEQAQQRADIDILAGLVEGTAGADLKLNAVNRSESPLAALQARSAAKGAAFFTQQQFDAGERLRLDFTRAMLMPRTSANWQASVSSGRRSGGRNGVEDLTASAMAARRHVDSALSVLGLELSGVAADICCFLKGFEQVEIERRWPRRSAKFMLKAALSILARHYWPQPVNNGHVRHWGTGDFRPSIGGVADER